MRRFISNTVAAPIAGLIIASSSILSSGCQNDGYIGELYGLWSLNEFYSDDNHISGEECDGYFIKFQTDVVQYVRNLPYHETQMYTGLWQQKSDSLFLNFPDIAGTRPSYVFADDLSDQQTGVIFPICSSLGFKINTLSNSVLDISHTTHDGIELRYYFKKLN